MASLPSDIVALIASEKSLGARPSWDDADSRYLSFIAPLTVGNVTTGGFELRVLVSKQWADRDALLQLEYAPAGRRDATELWRVDWRRFHTHVNKGRPPDLPFATLTDSHHHPFADNYLPNENRMFSGSLPAARPLENSPGTLSELLAFCGKLFKINDIGLVKLPDITGDLFWTQDG
jgi:hypothetical protein